MLTPEEHKEMAALLREAEKFLWDGKSAFVSWSSRSFTRPAAKEVQEPNLCSAICLAAYSLSNWQNSGEAHRLALSAQSWISTQLEGSLYLSGWLRQQGIDGSSDIPKLHATRKAWLHHMIAVLEA